MQNVTAIILAAGRGQRLGHITDNLPKALVSVGHRPLLGHTIDFVEKIGANKIIVVAGYCFDQIREYVSTLSDNILILENKDFLQQTLSSVRLGLNQVTNDNVFICNVDYIKSNDIARVIKNNQKGLAVFASRHFSQRAADDEMKIKLDSAGNLADISKTLSDFEAVYSGDFFCGSQYLADWKSAVSEATTVYGPDKAVTEHAMLIMKNKGFNLPIVDVGQADWYEIDTPEDLARAEAGFNKMN